MDFHTQTLLLAPILLRGLDPQYSTVGIKPKEEDELDYSLFRME